MTKLKKGLQELQKRAYAIAHSTPTEKIIIGGWKIAQGELRFFPLTAMKPRIRHCKSCLYFRKSSGGYCALQPEAFLNSETEACEGFLNRTWKSE